MNIYKLTVNMADIKASYMVYDSAIVSAKTEHDARMTHPMTCRMGYSKETGMETDKPVDADWTSHGWVNDPALVQVELIGKAARHIKPGVILVSFYEG